MRQSWKISSWNQRQIKRLDWTVLDSVNYPRQCTTLLFLRDNIYCTLIHRAFIQSDVQIVHEECPADDQGLEALGFHSVREVGAKEPSCVSQDTDQEGWPLLQASVAYAREYWGQD